jgi:hypothetical protein
VGNAASEEIIGRGATDATGMGSSRREERRLSRMSALDLESEDAGGGRQEGRDYLVAHERRGLLTKADLNIALDSVFKRIERRLTWMIVSAMVAYTFICIAIVWMMFG